MIVRQWRARASAEGAQKYLAHFRDEVAPGLRRTAGYLGAELLERETPEGDLELVVHTRWRSLDDIRAFAGETLDRAVVQADARAVLQSFDTQVRHYVVRHVE